MFVGEGGFFFFPKVVGQFLDTTTASGTETAEQNVITIGEALEAAGQTAGNKPVEQSDAAAIQAAEARATGSNVITLGGLTATAQSAAAFNAGLDRDEDKIKLNYVLTVSFISIPSDSIETRNYLN